MDFRYWINPNILSPLKDVLNSGTAHFNEFSVLQASNIVIYWAVQRTLA